MTGLSAAGLQTTAPPPVVSVKVMITDKGIKMRPRVGQRGAMARFILVNAGKKRHTLRFGYSKPGTGKQLGFTRTLKPNEQHVYILYLDYRGAIPYRATLPADRSKPGMKGTFRIT